VLAAQANFVRVQVERAAAEAAAEDAGAGAAEAEAEAEAGGELELLCTVRAVLKKMEQRVLVGDWVTVGSIDWTDRRGMVEEVLPRSSQLLSPAVANVEHILLMFAAAQPPLEPHNVSRFLVTAEAARLPVTLAFNKADLVAPAEMAALVERFRGWGYAAVPCSTQTGEGLEAVQEALARRTSVVAGPSGVGKSSLIKGLRRRSAELGGEVTDQRAWEDLRTLTVSARSGRGRHTTRHTSLLAIPGAGYLVDSPGFNQPSLRNVTLEALPGFFPEVRRALAPEGAACRFHNCRHLGEPGCAVPMDWERYPLYVELAMEVEAMEARARRAGEGKLSREAKVKTKAGRGGRGQRVEVKLDPKKHRRPSRKRGKQAFQQGALTLEDMAGLGDERR